MWEAGASKQVEKNTETSFRGLKDRLANNEHVQGQDGILKGYICTKLEFTTGGGFRHGR